MKPTTIEEVIAAIPEWRGLQVEAEPVRGGLTNRAYRVRVADRPYFVSVPGVRSELLTIPREDEIANARAAAETGASPRVFHYFAETGVMVVEFLQGRTLTIDDMHAAGMPERLAAAVRVLHSARPFANDFDLFRLTDLYSGLFAAQHLAPPDGFDGVRRRLGEMETAARLHSLPPRPCSNDLVPENLIDDGQRLWIVDFGYSGNNDPCSELGNACCEADYDAAEAERLCTAYFGAAEPRLLARMRLYSIMSDVAWSLWSVLQEQLSELEVDFHAYGGRRWQRALGLLNGPDLERWIREA